MENKKIKPIFKYIGGKSWLRDELRNEFNLSLKDKQFDTYIEPFCGGLGAFLNVYDILLDNNIKKAVLADINNKLINFYNVVLFDRKDLINIYMALENSFYSLIPKEALTLHTTKDKIELKKLLIEPEKYFKDIRTDFNSNKASSIKDAAYLLFLQNHCFNGIYRENSKGDYNTPFNWEAIYYNEQKITTKINDVYNILKLFDIKFLNCDYKNINFNDKSFYYLDPPYLNEKELVENNYNKTGFNLENQIELIKTIKDLTFVYSNHHSVELLKHFNKNIDVKYVSRKNIVSASAESRKTDKIEILIRSN